jgi:UDP-N-acetylglucosamine diphosphorylase/glucosamine-1-phosphate N-acetyltransferase
MIQGARVAASSIGEHSKIRGEFSTSIVIGHSNKGHSGFVGHSYFGRWVNLGALTTTSNLKNTYGPVHLWTPSGVRDTGQQFLGTLFGDHVKTGIGTMLGTGTVLGAGACIFGSDTPPRAVPPFAWGDKAPYETYDITKFLAVAERVMARRDVKLGDKERKHLAEAHKRRWSV